MIGIFATISSFFMKETFNTNLEDEILEEREKNAKSKVEDMMKK